MITAFGSSAQRSGAYSRILAREGEKLLVEFHTPARDLFGRQKLYRTVERVILYEPERVEFELVEGPLSMLRDRFILKAEDGCTRLRYESQFGTKGWIAGWLVGILYVRPMLRRLMREHLAEMKETIEARAKRSKAFPQQPCSPESRHQWAYLSTT